MRKATSFVVFSRTGHSTVDTQTGRRVLFENPILDSMAERGFEPEGSVR